MRKLQKEKRYAVCVLGMIVVLICLLVCSACNRTPNNPQQTSATDETRPEVTTDTESDRDTAQTEESATEAPKTLVFEDGITEETTSAGGVVKPRHELYENDFSEPVKDGNSDWFFNEAADVSGGVLTSKGNTHFYVAGKHRIKADSAKITLDLQAKRPGSPAHDSGYIGLRLPGYDDQFAAVGSKGIWLAFQNRSVGVINTWPNVTLFETEFDFSAPRRVYIEDDMESNEIAVYTDTEEGERVLVFRVIITDARQVTVVDAAGKTRMETTFSYDIDTVGYVAFWAHQNNGGVVYDNLSLEWDEKVRVPYTEADPIGIRDLYSDTWTATDGAWRNVSGDGSAVTDKLVGIFYEVWHTSTHTTYPDQLLYDHNAIYAQGGAEALKEAIASGPLGWAHYWAEPYFGYYLSTDRWIIRKHASMLADIGVDFIYLDVTNGEPFTNVYKTIFREYRAMREEGMDTPDICFFLSDSADPNVKVFDDLWDQIYANNEYSDLYVIYRGKPLIFGNLSAIDAERREKFTVRRCWALQENLGDGKDYWSWMCETPQVISYNAQTGEVEEMSVSAGILANLSIGRSYTVKNKQPALGILPNGKRDEFQFHLDSTPFGLLFAEQMKRAEEVDPYVVLVTGWNEWTAGRWETTGSGALIANTYLTGGKEAWTKSYYVDAFNPEFSRDIEPMKGGFGDNYYYQLAAFLRRFKGAREIPAADGQIAISEDGGAEQWSGVWPEYRDTSGDTMHRDSIGFGGFNYYRNSTGRNDILRAKVSRNGDSVWFMVECREEITAPEGSEWMNLFLDSDCNSKTGWAGYDFVIGRDSSAVINGKGKVSVHAFRSDTWEMQQIGEAELTVEGRFLIVRVAASLCGLEGDFDFKWADNSVSDGQVMSFLDRGDAAPNGRFNYAYRQKKGTTTLSENLNTCLAGGAGFVAGKSYMVSGKSVSPIDLADTGVAAQLTRNRFFVPAGALAHVEGFSVSVSADGTTATVSRGKTTLVFTSGSNHVAMGIDTVIVPVAPYIENGQLWIPLHVVAYYNGMQFLSDRYGRALITPADVEKLPDETVRRMLNELDRAI